MLCRLQNVNIIFNSAMFSRGPNADLMKHNIYFRSNQRDQLSQNAKTINIYWMSVCVLCQGGALLTENKLWLEPPDGAQQTVHKWFPAELCIEVELWAVQWSSHHCCSEDCKQMPWHQETRPYDKQQQIVIGWTVESHSKTCFRLLFTSGVGLCAVIRQVYSRFGP